MCSIIQIRVDSTITIYCQNIPGLAIGDYQREERPVGYYVLVFCEKVGQNRVFVLNFEHFNKDGKINYRTSTNEHCRTPAQDAFCYRWKMR